MTHDELTAKGFVQQSNGEFAKTILHPGCAGKIAELERDFGNGALGALQVQEPIGRSFLVCITSFRRRLLDEDNLAEKWHVDLCRYAGIIPEDSPGTTQIKVAQQKIGSKEQEFVRIEVFKV